MSLSFLSVAALDLLLRQSQKVSSPLRGHERTVQYLQKLGAKQADLIFEYATWVLSAHPEDGLKVGTMFLYYVLKIPTNFKTT